MDRLFEPLSFHRGPAMKNRFVLAPMTNLQSHADGVLSEEELHWLTLRAAGGFGLVMTCASHVQAIGQGFPGQLGIWSDIHVEGLTRLAAEIRRHGSIAVTQLHHAGLRSPAALIGTAPVSASDDEKTGARALSTGEVEQLTEDFILAAVRAEHAGFDGVQVHGAHGYIVCQFLSPTVNRRDDRYGGSLENRCRLLFDIVEGIRARCRPDFLLSVRLSPERFGMTLGESTVIAQRLMQSGLIDLLDMSLWDVFKKPEEEEFKDKPLLDWFTALDRGEVRLSVAGKIQSARDAGRVLAAGADLLTIGRAAILHHDFPEQCRDDPFFEPVELPVTADYLRSEGLSDPFIEYMKNWEGFVTAE
ncbi:MAG: NADH:flavin oxidoreductase [Xanthomonadales bacterium]|jgi:2,4-dienoyl-CoA reductase-like NADH-dependent reductase (Old Yellow Enzyme family)|nr:NADH:flavin oxidoreductase [Xanthomonadales bacterium]